MKQDSQLSRIESRYTILNKHYILTTNCNVDIASRPFSSSL